MKTRTLVYAAALLLLVTYSSCQDDSIVKKSEQSDQTTITLNIPSPQTISTYSMTPKEECEILTINVLVFNGTTNQYMYHEQGVDILDGTDATHKKFTMKLKQTLDPASVYILVYANVSQVIETAIADGTIAAGKTRDEIMQSLTFALPLDDTTDAQGGKWLVKPGRYTRFPMWGQSDAISLTDDAITVAPITLLRACAKIDIGLNFTGETATQLSNFYLEEYYLYNALNKLYIAPDPAKISGTTVTAESVPAGAEAFDVIKYLRRASRLDAGYKDFLNEIYLAEHPQGSTTSRSTNPCIVVGARFGTKTSAITYYRIDLVKTITDAGGVVTAQQYLPVLRNHRYKINILQVHDRGYDTPLEAFNAMGLNTNLDVDIVNQDESITEIVYDGQYMLGVDTKTYTVDKRIILPTEAKVLKISTNYEDGWKIKSNQTWLKFVNDANAEVATLTGTTGQTSVRFTVAANAGAQRTATITLQAGRLFQTIVVTQSIVAEIETTNVLSFYPMNAATKTFIVKSVHAWKAKIVDDDYNLITSFTASGGPVPSGQTYSFTTMNEIAEQNIPLDKQQQKIKIVLYSPTGEFDDFIQEVSVVASFFHAAGNFYVQPIDQPKVSWYVLSNTPINTNEASAPPTSGAQSSPAQVNSCAAIPSQDPSKPWRLPTTTELKTLYTGGAYLNYGMTAVYYRSANYSPAYSTAYGDTVNMSNNSLYTETKNTNTAPGRCIRSK